MKSLNYDNVNENFLQHVQGFQKIEQVWFTRKHIFNSVLFATQFATLPLVTLGVTG